MRTIWQRWRGGAKEFRHWLAYRREQRLRQADLALLLLRRDERLLADLGLLGEAAPRGDCRLYAGSNGACCDEVLAERPRWIS